MNLTICSWVIGLASLAGNALNNWDNIDELANRAFESERVGAVVEMTADNSTENALELPVLEEKLADSNDSAELDADFNLDESSNSLALEDESAVDSLAAEIEAAFTYELYARDFFNWKEEIADMARGYLMNDSEEVDELEDLDVLNEPEAVAESKPTEQPEWELPGIEVEAADSADSTNENTELADLNELPTLEEADGAEASMLVTELANPESASVVTTESEIALDAPLSNEMSEEEFYLALEQFQSDALTAIASKSMDEQLEMETTIETQSVNDTNDEASEKESEPALESDSPVITSDSVTGFDESGESLESESESTAVEETMDQEMLESDSSIAIEADEDEANVEMDEDAANVEADETAANVEMDEAASEQQEQSVQPKELPELSKLESQSIEELNAALDALESENTVGIVIIEDKSATTNDDAEEYESPVIDEPTNDFLTNLTRQLTSEVIQEKQTTENK